MSCEQEQAMFERAQANLASADAALNAAKAAFNDALHEASPGALSNAAKKEFGVRPDAPSTAERQLKDDVDKHLERMFDAKKEAVNKAGENYATARHALDDAAAALAACRAPKRVGLLPGGPRRWLVGGAIGGVTAIVAVAVITQPGPRTSAPPTPVPTAASVPNATALNQLLVIKTLKDSLTAPVTLYTVAAEDAAGAPLSYSWTMTPTSPDGQCGTPLVTWTRTGAEVPWSHATLPPDNCKHLGTDHPVKAVVTVKVMGGKNIGVTAVCELVGSESQTILPPNTACRFSL